MEKRVLLSYIDRKKQVIIPPDTVDNMNYLKQEFLSSFNFSKNIKMAVTFQRYDPEWDDFVDLDDCAVIENKDKLKVVVCPLLADVSSCSTTSEVSTIFLSSLFCLGVLFEAWRLFEIGVYTRT